MRSFQTTYDPKGQLELRTTLRGRLVLEDSCLNKETAFSDEERTQLGLRGFLPAEEEGLAKQAARAYEAYKRKHDDLERHIFLRAVQDRNEVLFYYLLKLHLNEMLPMIYTPVVGLACQEFHKITRRVRGLFISYPDRFKIEEILNNLDLPDVKIIVVSDGERILGLGDQGSGGMGIPIGKISLYTACGGVYPGYGLPILLDVGTDNQDRLDDPLYLGWRHKRVRGPEYDEFVDLFVKAIMRKFPNVLLQWEDFAKDHARLLLDRYQNQLCTFNDDIQGTASVTLAGLLAAAKVAKSRLVDQQIVIYGAGSAGTGIADQIAAEMVRQGLSQEEACRHIWLIDRTGLIHSGTPNPTPAQKPYVQPLANLNSWKKKNPNQISFEEVVENLHPTALVGVSASAGAFQEKIVREMAKHVERPIIFPLSNPTEKCEAQPKDLVEWTNGKALIATGTRFPDVTYQGKAYQIGQCNNFYIFPAMGLGILSSKAKRVTNSMFLAAAEALSSLSPAIQDPSGSLFPNPTNVREIAKKIAFSVAKQAIQDKVAPSLSDGEIQEAIHATYWEPAYAPVRAC